MKDYYELLDIKKSASISEVKRAYRKMARRFHPDLNPNDEIAEIKFREISEAYEILVDPRKRKQYDTYGYYRRTRTTSGQGGFSDFAGFNFQQRGSSTFSDIFQTIFGDTRSRYSRDSGGRSVPQSGEDLHYYMTLGFEDAARGLNIPIQLRRKRECPRCRGRGIEKETTRRVCPDCQGKGTMNKQTGFMQFQASCRRCRGTGHLSGQPCSRCQGEGRIDQNNRIMVTIPPGIDDNTKLKIAGKGNAGRQGGTAGDLIISIKVEPHRFFRKEEGVLHLELPVTFTEAALGARVEVPTLEGHTRIKIPPGTNSGQKLRLAGKGIHNPKTRKKGDMVVKIKIISPSIKDLEVRELLRKLEEKNPEDPREMFS